MGLFYQIFKQVLLKNGHESKVRKMKEHIVKHRKTSSQLRKWLEEIGFIIDKQEEDVFSMTFMDGTAIFNYHFIRHWFLPSWLEIMEGKDEQLLYRCLEETLNEYAESHQGIKLEIPYICFKCIKS